MTRCVTCYEHCIVLVKRKKACLKCVYRIEKSASTRLDGPVKGLPLYLLPSFSQTIQAVLTYICRYKTNPQSLRRHHKVQFAINYNTSHCMQKLFLAWPAAMRGLKKIV